MSKQRVAVDKRNVVLDQLEVQYLPVDNVKPNSYNPNRQSAHDFDLLCKSIKDDGFTQPIVVQKDTLEIVDGEHRWRACKHLGYTEVPCVLTAMTPEQMRIATLRHNRARGSEDASLAADVLKQLADMGAVDFAAERLGLDELEVDRLLKDMSGQDETALIATPVAPSQLGPSGTGLSAIDKKHNIDFTADERRAKEKLLAEAKAAEEAEMAAKDGDKYRLVLFFAGEEARVVRSALDGGDGNAKNLLALCREAAAS